MKYKELFAVDPISYDQRKKNNEKTPKYYLKNFDYDELKMDSQLYLHYFLRELLFDIPVAELNDFINFHYDCSEAPDDLLQVLDYEVLPMIKDIVENAHLSMTGGGYYNQVELEDGFIETEGIIKNTQYELSTFSHLIALKNNKSQVLKRKEILKTFLRKLDDLNISKSDAPLQWIAGPAQLGFIISELVQNGYIKPPIINTKNGVNKGKLKINYSQLSQDVLAAFTMSEHNSTSTLRAYLNPETHKHGEIKKTFDYNGFSLPNNNFLS